jgi:hypothetical protein
MPDVESLDLEIAINTEEANKGIRNITTQLTSMGKVMKDTVNNIEVGNDLLVEGFSQLSRVVTQNTANASASFDHMYKLMTDRMKGLETRFTNLSKKNTNAFNRMANAYENYATKLSEGLHAQSNSTNRQIQSTNSAIKRLTENVDKLTTSLDKVAKAQRNHATAMRDTSHHADTLMGKFRVMSLNLYIIAYNVRALGEALNSVLGRGIQYNMELEVSRMGMAGILSSMTKIDGKQTDWNTSLGIANEMMEQLKLEALRTAATSSELVGTFQALLAPGLRAKMSLEEIKQLTVVGVNAVKSIGLSAHQVVQELRDLVAGGITAASSTLATALGLKDKDIKAARDSADGLFKFLMDRLKGFRKASSSYADTLKGSFEQLREGIEMGMGKGLESLTRFLSQEMNKIASLMVIDKGNGLLEPNPAIVETYKVIGFFVVDIYQGLQRLAIEVMPLIQRTASNIANVFMAIYSNIGSIAAGFGAYFIASRGVLTTFIAILTYTGKINEVLTWISNNIEIAASILLVYVNRVGLLAMRFGSVVPVLLSISSLLFGIDSVIQFVQEHTVLATGAMILWATQGIKMTIALKAINTLVGIFTFLLTTNTAALTLQASLLWGVVTALWAKVSALIAARLALIAFINSFPIVGQLLLVAGVAIAAFTDKLWKNTEAMDAETDATHRNIAAMRGIITGSYGLENY